MQHVDVAIAGAGLIGSSLALELANRGLQVALLSDGPPLSHASTAAAGMLAVDDPENPPALHAISALSRTLYPEFLSRLTEAAGTAADPVSFQTRETLQAFVPEHAQLPPEISQPELHRLAPGLRSNGLSFAVRDEASLDPRELAAAVLLALRRSGRIQLHTAARVPSVTDGLSYVTVETGSAPVTADHFVDCTGAWLLAGRSTVPVFPRKGQLLSVALASEMPLTRVVRTPSIYIVPRLHGPRAGLAVIGATVEERGFDVSVEPAAIAGLQARAAALFPALATALVIETWAGLRPATPDGLPVIGRTGYRTFIAKGHFRNGILLAPATAQTVADLITGRPPAVDLAPFSPDRAVFAPASNNPSPPAPHNTHLV